jgi:hypothetical protein
LAGEKLADPPLMVPDDGFLGPIRTGPGGLSYYRAGTNDRIEPLPISINLAEVEAMMAQKRESIAKIFLNHQLQAQDMRGPDRTATEVMIMQQEAMRLLGPVLTRFVAEFLVPLIERVYGTMDRGGHFGAKPEILGGWVPEYTSPLANAQRQYEVQSMSNAMQYLAPFIGEGDPFGVMDNFDIDAIARHAMDVFSVPPEIKRSEDERDAVRQQKQQQAQAQAQAMQMREMAGAAKDLGQAKTDGTALGALGDAMGRAQTGGEA